jgi:hypothetical protein
MIHASSGPLAVTAAVLLAACGMIEPAPDAPEPASRLSPHSPHVSERSEFRGGGSVLNVLRARTAGMQVRRPPSEPCPEITLRGPTSLTGSNSPVIYVDGTRTSNTCILDMLNVNDVERVEVYPMGIAPGGTHRNSPTGLILVFLRRG